MLLLLAARITSTTVLADTEQLFNDTVEVKNLAFSTITRSIDVSSMTNVKLQGSIDVISGGSISVYVMDANGYQQYQQNRQARQSALYRAEDVMSQTLSVPISTSGNYYVVLDNENSLLTSKTVRVQLSLSFDRPFLSATNPTLLYAIVGVAVMAVGAAAIFIFMRRRPRSPIGLSSHPAAVVTEVGFKNCVFCRAVMHEMAKTCPACGKPQP